jgi:hypothetical protein
MPRATRQGDVFALRAMERLAPVGVVDEGVSDAAVRRSHSHGSGGESVMPGSTNAGWRRGRSTVRVPLLVRIGHLIGWSP